MKLQNYQLNWLSTFLEFKLSLDEEYERETHGESGSPFNEDLFIASEISEEDLVFIYEELTRIEASINEDEARGGYLDSCDRDTAWEIYLSTSGHGAGFFDHGTEEGDAIQAHLDKHFPYVCEQWHFYTGDDGSLCFFR